jgi:hypothetical protein
VSLVLWRRQPSCAFSWVEKGSQALRIVFGLLLADIGVSFVAMLVLLCRKRAVSRTSARP